MLIYKSLFTAPNRAVAVATLLAALETELEGPATTLAANFIYLPPLNASTIPEYYDTFENVISKDDPNTLLGLAKDAYKK